MNAPFLAGKIWYQKLMTGEIRYASPVNRSDAGSSGR